MQVLNWRLWESALDGSLGQAEGPFPGLARLAARLRSRQRYVT